MARGGRLTSHDFSPNLRQLVNLHLMQIQVIQLGNLIKVIFV